MFNEELGTMKEFKVKLVIKPEAIPQFDLPCFVPYALKGGIEQERNESIPC